MSTNKNNSKIRFASSVVRKDIGSMEELNRIAMETLDEEHGSINKDSYSHIQQNVDSNPAVVMTGKRIDNIASEVVEKVKQESTTLPTNATNVVKESKQKLYESRSISWLKFNKRVLELAKDKSVPLFERAKFLSITESNLDEFNMVRIPKMLSGRFNEEQEQLTNKEFKEVKNAMYKFIAEQHRVHEELIKELSAEGFEMIVNKEQLTKKEFGWAKKYFKDKVRSVLTPIVYDNMRPFQLLKNDKTYIGVMIEDNNLEMFGTIEVPSFGDRIIEIESSEPGKRKFILIENLIRMFVDQMFKAINDKTSVAIFRALKSTDYEVETDEIVVEILERKLRRNEHGDVMRVDIIGDYKGDIKDTLRGLVGDAHTIFNKVKGQSPILNLTYMMEFMKLKITSEQETKFKYSEFKPRISDKLVDANLFDIISKEDIILQHPYEPYQTVIDFINQAALDPNTVGIKQTLYRVSKDSPVVAALVKAARNGVMVTVICEVKARFDEIHNIEMAREIEKAGGQVIYGINDLKIHSKMCMVTRKTKKGNLERFVHLGTGNYNEKTSKIYTDISYFTSKSHIVEDVEDIFNSLTGYSTLKPKKLFCSPNGIANKIISLIDKQSEIAKSGKDAYINIKVNGLTDKKIINKLYEAADAGVKITLIVRGMCCLVDTSKITVKSIVGRFLEHSRIYEFGSGGDSEIYISSADLMERNLYNRVELLIPINSAKAKKRVTNIMETYIKDESAFFLINGEYVKTISREEFVRSEKEIKTDNSVKEELNDTEKRIFSSQEYNLENARKARKIPIHKLEMLIKNKKKE